MKIEESELRKLLDKEAIREATLHYTRGIDRHDDDIMGQAYHADATDDHGTYIGDAAGFIQHAGKVHSAGFVGHQHYVTNQTIDLDGDTAHAETYYFAALRKKGGGIMLAGGRYLDRLERRANRWAITHRSTVIDWNGELNEPSAPLLDLFLTGTWDKTDVSYMRPLTMTRAPRDVTT